MWERNHEFQRAQCRSFRGWSGLEHGERLGGVQSLLGMRLWRRPGSLRLLAVTHINKDKGDIKISPEESRNKKCVCEVGRVAVSVWSRQECLSSLTL